jgi:hypothetical protein
MADQEPIEQVYSRTAVVDHVSMWGKLFVNKLNRKAVGWLVDTWTELGVDERLRPKMHWVSIADGKFHHSFVSGDFRLGIAPGGEDTEIESKRAAVIRANLERWEQEYIQQQSR